jgi:hypothetical protein
VNATRSEQMTRPSSAISSQKPREEQAPASRTTEKPTAETRPGLVRSWVQFWFSPIDAVGLHYLRVLAGLLFLAFLLPFAGHVDAFFGQQGWLDLIRPIQQLPEQLRPDRSVLLQQLPVPIGWSALYLAGDSSVMLHTLYWLSVGVLVLFTLGIATRVTSVLTWVVIASFIANPLINYGADALLVILAFYLMIGYVFYGQWCQPLSLWERVLGPRQAWLFDPWRNRSSSPEVMSYAANLAIRLIQLHFALVVVVTGLHKLQFADWWAGVAFWYPLHPPFASNVDDLRKLAPDATSYLALLSASQYAMLAWQLGFPLFAWRPQWWWRTVLLGGAALGWIGSVFLYGLPLFGPFFFIACLAFLTPAEWRALATVPGRVLAWWRQRRALVADA